MILNIPVLYLYWHYFETPKEILRIWRNFIIFFYHYFSIGLLLKTIFAPWRRDITYYGRGFDIKLYAEIIAFNLVARGVGFFIRSLVIFAGIFVEILVFFAGILIFIAWLILPVLILIGLYYGWRF